MAKATKVELAVQTIAEIFEDKEVRNQGKDELGQPIKVEVNKHAFLQASILRNFIWSLNREIKQQRVLAWDCNGANLCVIERAEKYKADAAELIEQLGHEDPTNHEILNGQLAQAAAGYQRWNDQVVMVESLMELLQAQLTKAGQQRANIQTIEEVNQRRGGYNTDAATQVKPNMAAVAGMIEGMGLEVPKALK